MASLYIQHSDDPNHENICWLMNPCDDYQGPSYKSPFHQKVKWDNWLARNGCCRTMGPPPHISTSCPEHFLKKHSRNAPVFFSPEELKVTKKQQLQQQQQHGCGGGGGGEEQEKYSGHPHKKPPPEPVHKPKPCIFPKPPFDMGLFRSPREPSYESRYKNIKPGMDCSCDLTVQDLISPEKCNKRDPNRGKKTDSGIEEMRRGKKSQGPSKDHIRANAVKAIRMPARRLRRCYVDGCGIHLIDMTDSPFVLRPGFGKVPPYIYRRKMELLQEDIALKQYVHHQAEHEHEFEGVDDVDRDTVIRGLQQYLDDLFRQYSSLPEDDSHCMDDYPKDIKARLEARMKEVEADIKLLKNPEELYQNTSENYECSTKF